MVSALFEGSAHSEGARVLDPGCGRGAFVDGILRWAQSNSVAAPRILAVDSDAAHVAHARERFADHSNVAVRCADFLTTELGKFDFIVGNPPYVPLTGLSASEREQYRKHFHTAAGRFDLYLLFFERAMKCLAPNGRLSFITPEKYLYVETAAPLRRILSGFNVERLEFVGEDTFEGRITYPLITTVVAAPPNGDTEMIMRDGSRKYVMLRDNSGSWLAYSSARAPSDDSLTLGDVCLRVSCGVATGADQIFVKREDSLPVALREFAYPTVSGRQILPNGSIVPSDVMLLPYDADGKLLFEFQLGELGRYLSDESNKEKLLSRTCVGHKPWYAFHETPPLRFILRPKILCKDIGEKPLFVIDKKGEFVPRHSVYYIVPPPSIDLQELAAYLNSPEASAWLRAHCQRAANGYIRLQSHVLKKLPLPDAFARGMNLFSGQLEEAS
jgi:SAM-dependent methyltransferase